MMASFNAVQTAPTPTIRLPPPPIKPKPLHLTMSLRHRPAAGKPSTSGSKTSYPQMPRWSMTSSEDGDEGTVRRRNSSSTCDQEREEAREAAVATKSLDLLFAPSPRAEYDGSEDGPTRTTPRRPLDASDGSFQTARGGGSTIKGKRISIYFDATQPNPFLPPVASSTDAELSDDDLLAAAEAEVATATEAAIDSLLSLSTDSEHCPPGSTAELELELRPTTLSALAIHAFEGEAAFGELSFPRGAELRIEVDDLGGNWSLGYLLSAGESARGLIPRGFVAYLEAPVHESPVVAEPDAHSPLPTPIVSSPPISLEPEVSLTPPRPASPAYATRSIGRSVVISGVEFEPAIPTPSPRLPFSKSVDSGRSYFDLQQAVQTPPPTREEMREFFSPSLALDAPHPATPLGEVEMEDADASLSIWPADQDVQLSTEGDESVNIDVNDSCSSALFDSPSSALALSQRKERESAPSPSPSKHQRLPSPTDDTQAARESRWSALIEQAEQRASRMGLESLFEAEEDEGEAFLSTEQIHHSRPATPTSAPTTSTTLTTSSSPSVPPSIMTYRLGLGLGSTSTLDSLSAVSSRPALTHKTSEQSSSGRGPLRIVQDWIRDGDSDESAEAELAEVWHIESGPSWRTDIPPFTVMVHSPERRPSLGNKSEHTVYQLTTLFPSAPSSASSSFTDPNAEAEADDESDAITVERRFSHFVALRLLLETRYPILTIPQLPSGSYAGRFDPTFVEARRRDLERWLSRVSRSPVLRGCSELRGFLTVEGEKDLQAILSLSTSSLTSFFSRVFHPEFNVDPIEAQELVDRFERHVKASELGDGVREVEASLGQVRESMRDSAQSQLALAHSLGRLVAGLALPPASTDTPANLGEDDLLAISGAPAAEKERTRSRVWCLQTEDGALSFRNSDSDGLSTTKAVQATAEVIAQLAKLQDGSARTDLLLAQELLVELSHPHLRHTLLINTHKLALIEHQRLTDQFEHDDGALDRCETILNITSAELDRVQVERQQDLRRVAELLLDSQIAMHEQSIVQLRFASSHFDPDSYAALAQTGPRLRSPLERAAPTAFPPLPKPSSYGASSSGSAGVMQAVGNVLALGRSNSTRSESAVRGLATAATIGRSAKGALQTYETSSKQLKENVRDWQRDQPRGTWRDSIFGTARFW